MAVLGLPQSRKYPGPRSTLLPTRLVCTGHITEPTCLWLQNWAQPVGSPRRSSERQKGSGPGLLLISLALSSRGGLGHSCPSTEVIGHLKMALSMGLSPPGSCLPSCPFGPGCGGSCTVTGPETLPAPVAPQQTPHHFVDSLS